MSILARSANWTISNDYEEVRAQRTDGLNVCIADHYGDATCATIADDESWVAVGGEGVTMSSGATYCAIPVPTSSKASIRIGTRKRLCVS